MLLFVFDVAYAGRLIVKSYLGSPVVTATTTANSVTLTWTAIENATSYEVTFNGEPNPVTEETTFTAYNLKASTEYSFSVVAKGDDERYEDSNPATGKAKTGKAEKIEGIGGKGPEKVKWDKKDLWVIVGFVAGAIIIIIIVILLIKYYTNPNCPITDPPPPPPPKCNICGGNLDANGKCPNPDCPSKPQRTCNICRSNLGANGKCTNPNCPSNQTPPPKCNICRSNLGANGKCTNPNCPGKSRICEFCNKIITEAHKQDQLCPSNWINPIKLDKDKIWIKREPNAQGGQGHIHPVWVKDSSIEWLYKNFASNKIFELERQTLIDLNKEGIDFVPIYYREHEKGFIMAKADGDNLNNVFGLKGTKETKQIEKVKIIRFIKKMCDAIEKLHLKGISHRDLKPVNIFYDLGKEKITIIDFGSVAKKEKGNSNSKAPFGDDYKCGKDGGVDFESGKQRDIYAVGIIIKEIWEKCLLEDKQEIYDILYKTTCDNQKERVNITELINLIESKWGALK